MTISTPVYFLMVAAVFAAETLLFAYLAYISFVPPDKYVEDNYVLQLLGHNATHMTVDDGNGNQVIPSYLRLAMRGASVSE